MPFVAGNQSIRGINLFGNELKLSQFAEDTNLFCADLISVQKAFSLILSVILGRCRSTVKRENDKGDLAWEVGK